LINDAVWGARIETKPQRFRAVHLSGYVDEVADRQHPALGTVTLSQLLATWAAHDLTHLHQISRVMATNIETK